MFGRQSQETGNNTWRNKTGKKALSSNPPPARLFPISDEKRKATERLGHLKRDDLGVYKMCLQEN